MPLRMTSQNRSEQAGQQPAAAATCERPELKKWCARVRETLSSERFAHVMRVTDLAEQIALAHSFSEEETRVTVQAALLHDIARELPAEELFRLAPPQLPLEFEHPLTVHGRAGRKMAEQWGVTDEHVLSAIEGHVFGVSESNRPGVAVYIADVCEPGRGVNDDIRELALTDLGGAYRLAVSRTTSYLQSIGVPIHPGTARVCRELGPA